MRTRTYATVAMAAALALGGCGQADDDSPQDTEESQPADSADTQPAGDDNADSDSDDGSGDEGSNDDSDSISLDEAGKIVTDEYGGEVIGVEDDDFRGTPAWEVEVKDSDEGRIEVKVDKESGEILDMEHD